MTQPIDAVALGERLGALSSSQEMMLEDIQEIKTAVSGLQRDFSTHIQDDRLTADRITRIETSIANIESVTTAIADKHRDAVRIVAIVKWLLVALGSSVAFLFAAYDHIKEFVHK